MLGPASVTSVAEGATAVPVPCRVLRSRAGVGVAAVAVALCLSAWTTSRPVRAQQPLTIFFYSAESNVNNFSSLKAEFDRYLATQGAFRFQPFSDRATFEQTIRGEREGIFVLSSWHFQNLSVRMPMEPLLVGVSKNQSARRRILSARLSVTSLDQLRNAKVASAVSDDYTQTLLRQMMPGAARGGDPGAKVLVVPKDIDALMAVGFGIADAAVTTEDGLAQLSQVNPKLAGAIHTLATSERVLLPIVAVPRGAGEAMRQLIGIVETMGRNAEGAKRLNMIGFDALKRLTDAELRILQQ